MATTTKTATSTTAAEEQVREKEKKWVLNEVCEEVQTSVKDGLEECLGRLCEKHSGFKLVVSSSKSEAVKGTITRAGAAIDQVDLTVKLPSITTHDKQPLTIRLNSGSELALTQVVDAANYVTEALQAVTTCFDKQHNPLVRVQTSAVLSYIRNAINTLKSPPSTIVYPLHVTDTSLFIDLSPNIVVDVYVSDSSLITDIRAVEYFDTHNDKFFSMFKKHHSSSSTIPYNNRKVIEHERIRVASQDPNLISVTAKLTALEQHLETIRRKLDICLL